jgi:hypothetical protein
MSLNKYLAEMIGKTIQHVVVKKGDSYPEKQLFLVFTDGTSMEFFGSDVNNAKGLWPHGLESVRLYCSDRPIIFEFGPEK